jgi:hypothetical protein
MAFVSSNFSAAVMTRLRAAIERAGRFYKNPRGNCPESPPSFVVV